MLIVSVAVLASLYKRNKNLEKDVERLSHNMTIIAEPWEYTHIDSTVVIKHEALKAKYDELEKQHLTDTELIKKLKVRLKDTEAIQTISVASADTIYLEPTSVKQDSTFAYTDKWISLSIDIPNRLCAYRTTDSLSTIVSRTYKHKFLWWRWGTKGYQVQIVNHNPHSKVTYSKYVKVE